MKTAQQEILLIRKPCENEIGSDIDVKKCLGKIYSRFEHFG